MVCAYCDHRPIGTKDMVDRFHKKCTHPLSLNRHQYQNTEEKEIPTPSKVIAVVIINIFSSSQKFEKYVE